MFLTIGELRSGHANSASLVVEEISNSQARVYQALQTLPQEMAEMISGRYGIGRRQADARALSHEFGKSVATVRRNWKRAEAILAARLEDVRPVNGS